MAAPVLSYLLFFFVQATQQGVLLEVVGQFPTKEACLDGILTIQKELELPREALPRFMCQEIDGAAFTLESEGKMPLEEEKPPTKKQTCVDFNGLDCKRNGTFEVRK